MRKHHRFRPSATEELEARVVLSHGLARNPSVVVSGLTPKVKSVGKTLPQAIAPLINKTFDAFVQDYTQARATYLSSGSADMSSNMAFQNYSHFRVTLLAQQLTSSVLQSSLSNSRQRGTGPTLPLLIGKLINGTDDKGFKGGTLGKALMDTIPKTSDSAAAIALDSLAQDQAIESARVGVMNGLNIIKNGDFGNKSENHNQQSHH